jgi:hypothetical protein
LAEDLKVNQSLMPMYTREDNGYEIVKLNSKPKGWNSVYKLVAQTLKNEEIKTATNRAKVDGSDKEMKYPVAIHHKDFNKHNNVPTNLQIMTSKEHWHWHADNLSLRWKQDTNFKNKTITALKSPAFSKAMVHRFDNETQKERDTRLEKDSTNNIGKHNRPHTKEEKLLMSVRSKGKNKGHVVSEETKHKISVANTGHIMSTDLQQKLYTLNKGAKRPRTKEWQDKLTQAIRNSEGWKNNKYINKQRSQITKDKMKDSHLSMSSEQLEVIRKKSLLTRWKKRVDTLLSKGLPVTLDTFINTFDVTNRKR